MKQHKCFKDIDEKLKSHNTRLSCNLLDHNELLIATERIETGRWKKRAALVVATFCPFCGEKLKTKQGDDTEKG